VTPIKCPNKRETFRFKFGCIEEELTEINLDLQWFIKTKFATSQFCSFSIVESYNHEEDDHIVVNVERFIDANLRGNHDS
jgi:hypothetical protein